jgi:uncharacterized FlgJ-related protein
MIKFDKIFIGLSCALIGFAAGWYARTIQNPLEIRVKVVKIDTVAYIHETPEMVMQEVLNKAGVEPAMVKLIIAQAKHESADFSSLVFMKTNNPFGMGHPYKRKTTSIGRSPSGYAKYKDLQSATLDYVYYLEAFHYPLNICESGEYVKMLKAKHYFEAEEKAYLKCVNSHLKTVNV